MNPPELLYESGMITAEQRDALIKEREEERLRNSFVANGWADVAKKARELAALPDANGVPRFIDFTFDGHAVEVDVGACGVSVWDGDDIDEADPSDGWQCDDFGDFGKKKAFGKTLDAAVKGKRVYWHEIVVA